MVVGEVQVDIWASLVMADTIKPHLIALGIVQDMAVEGDKRGDNMNNKYELMGQYVSVKEYLKPARKGNKRSHQPVVLNKPRIGMVVGYRTVYDGKIHLGSDQGGFSYDFDYSPPWFEATGTIPVLLVCFWPRYKPVLVKLEDAKYIYPNQDITYYLHPTSYKWTDKDKAALKKDMQLMPRDEKGRWKK